MTKLDPREIVRLILSSASATDTPTLLHDLIARHALGTGLVSSLDSAFEAAEPVVREVRRLIGRAQADAEGRGEVWVMEIYGTEDEYIRGSSHPDRSLSDAEQQSRANRRHIEDLRTALVSLTYQEFESACTAILRIMGCSDPQTSPSSDDGGIDFYGRLDLKGRLDNPAPYGGIDQRTGVWLVGQAKHYPTRPIQTGHLRELVGSVELARTGGAIHVWEGLRLRPFDAVIQLLFTTGTFTSGSEKLLEKTGLVAMSGDQLAAFLADAGIGIDVTSSAFDSAKFRADLGLDQEIRAPA